MFQADVMGNILNVIIYVIWLAIFIITHNITYKELKISYGLIKRIGLGILLIINAEMITIYVFAGVAKLISMDLDILHLLGNIAIFSFQIWGIYIMLIFIYLVIRDLIRKGLK